MWLTRRHARLSALVMAGLSWAGVAGAEVQLAEAGGWKISTDGRLNGFISHVWGDDRPKGNESLPWVGFNESGSDGQTDAEGKLRKTRVRSGYVPSTLAFNLQKQVSEAFKVSGRVEIGFQIANVDQAAVANPTWMDPRAVYLDLSGRWGSVRAGRDLGLFSRGNLFMNYELGHAYGLGFPCAYATVFGGSCGHVGFGTLWPDFHAQLTYSTPWFEDIFQWSAGVFDPRVVTTYAWERTPLPRFETEAVAKFNWKEGWGVKAWGNGALQTLGTGWNIRDPANPNLIVGRKEVSQTAYGVGGGVQANLGPFKAGVAGYGGRGMDGYEFISFNPVFMSQRSTGPDGLPVERQDRRMRTAKGFLVEASVTLGNTWFMGGFGRAMLDRIPEDAPIEAPGAPLLRTQTGISAGVFHRIQNVVLGLDYFNAHYGFDPLNVGTLEARQFVDIEQRVNIVNGGVTLEW